MKRRFKDEKGYAFVEAAIVFPIVLLIYIAFLYFAIALCQRANLQANLQNALTYYKNVDSDAYVTAKANMEYKVSGTNTLEAVGTSYQDANTDEYHKNYYQTTREYAGYPYYTKAKPYILGLPGVRYFEFDLSGQFEPQNRLGTTDIEKLPAQVITLASNTGATINVSDTELEAAKVTADGYTFTPSYLNEEVPATTSYPLNATGSSFDVTATAAPVGAFRPYFTSAATSPSKQYRSIIFGELTTDTEFKADESLSLADRGEGLRVSGGNGTITIESGLKTTARVRIVNAVGITMASFMLEPGATVTTQLVPGVYIVAGKKVAIR